MLMKFLTPKTKPLLLLHYWQNKIRSPQWLLVRGHAINPSDGGFLDGKLYRLYNSSTRVTVLQLKEG